MRFLIADDDEASRQLVLRIASKYGECDMAVNGIEAVDAFIGGLDQQNPYDLIFLDIMMPIYEGTKVLKSIRNIESKRKIIKNKRIRVFITSALYNKQQVEEMELLGIDEYFRKPFDVELLQQKISVLKKPVI